MRVALFDNLANNAYIEAKGFRAAGWEVDLICDPLDSFVMSDPRWEELDLELPSATLAEARLPDHPLPEWVRFAPGAPPGPTADPKPLPRRAATALRRAASAPRELAAAARVAGSTGALIALSRTWVMDTFRGYDCILAYGNGAIWAGLAGVPCVAVTYGGDITMAPFFDTGDWEDHETVPLPGAPRELFAQAKLARYGYDWAHRIILTDPRFLPYARRLGHESKSEVLGFYTDTDTYAPAPEPELRAEILGGEDGLILFMPSRQDWHWKGSDRLLRGLAAADTAGRRLVLVCAGWGSDLDRSKQLIAELGITDRVQLLDHAMSKGRLRRYYRAADIVADQFTVGSYGASALEAMSFARPLFIDIDTERFRDHHTGLPPVVNVSTPEEIAAALTSLVADDDERGRVGQRGRDWVRENHGQTVLEGTMRLCEAAAEQRG